MSEIHDEPPQRTALLLIIGAAAIAAGVGFSLVVAQVNGPRFSEICQDAGGIYDDGECLSPTGEVVATE